MANNKIKHKLLKFKKKFEEQKKRLEDQQKNYEVEKLQKQYEEKKERYIQLLKMKEKIKVAKRKNKEITDNWIKNNKEKYKDQSDNINEIFLHQKNLRDEYIKKLKDEYIDAKLSYAYEFETTGFKIKRWFYGLQKEINRITWMTKKNVFVAFGVVVSITLFLSILFLIINLIFSKGI